MNSIVFVLFLTILAGSNQISEAISDDIPSRLIELNEGFVELHDSYIELLQAARDQQTHDERVLQAQLFSRIAFISNQVKDLDFATHRRIIERGLRIGNTAAECIIEADMLLQMYSVESGQEIMEIASIASKDFQRIPNEFVHPFFDHTQHKSKGFLKAVTKGISQINAVRDINELVDDLQAHQEEARAKLATFDADLQAEMNAMRKEMNYVKAEVFPILEYSLRYYRQATDKIVENLENCN